MFCSVDQLAPSGHLEKFEAAGRLFEPAGHTAGHVSSGQLGDFEPVVEQAGWRVGSRLQVAMLC